MSEYSTSFEIAVMSRELYILYQSHPEKVGSEINI